MNVANNSYAFRSVVSGDLDILSEWLKESMVSRWYQDPDYIDHLEENLHDRRIRMQLVLHNAEPIAYIQDYDIHAWADHHLAYLPKNSRGIDTFIGSNKLIGKGHGTNYLSLFVRQLFIDGVPALGIDPHPENTQARRAYQKVGFAEDGKIKSQWGEVVLMSMLTSRTQYASELSQSNTLNDGMG